MSSSVCLLCLPVKPKKKENKGKHEVTKSQRPEPQLSETSIEYSKASNSSTAKSSAVPGIRKESDHL